MDTNLTYETAYSELQEIVAAIQEESVTVDELSVKVKRAAELTAYCQSRLRATEKEVEKIIRQMESGK